ncbi:MULTISPECIES: hypothetical protein [Vibrio]|uniref:hypothetical protein n=1 Tax=Vibrio TaxID=662 RepID=UPI0013315816|nr:MULTISPECIES: hypothetical protein [Vibrio]MCG6221536.1 hypothetical protein [Vibrio diabolicus]MDF5453476.1 hypothetical protein [Vibrio parahaemolyticus]MDW1977404.1 hypothetical protein [Vibrio sp. Vb1980]NMS06393.1 hypothetical protein [Vibrio parahaemolyticus]
MKYTEELSKLIIDNIEQHERSHLVIEEVDRVVIKAIEKETEAFFEGFDSKLIEKESYSFYDYDAMSLSFFEWRVEGNENNLFGINLVPYSDNGEETQSWLAYLCGIPYKSTGLSLQFFTEHQKVGITANNLKKFLVTFLEESLKLRENGFKVDSTGYYIEKTFNFDKDIILQYYPHQLPKAMNPLTDTLQTFQECKPEFDRLVEELKLQGANG